MLQPNPELQKSLHNGTELFKFKTHHVILAHRQVASEAVADFDQLIKRLRALKYLTDAAGGGHGHASKKDCHVLPHGSLTDNHTDTLPLIGYFTTNF